MCISRLTAVLLKDTVDCVCLKPIIKSFFSYSTMEFNYGQHFADVQCCRHLVLQLLRTFNVADVRSCNQRFNVATTKCCNCKMLFTSGLNSHVHIMFFAYSNDIHNNAINVLLTQQLFTVLFFLVKFKTLGLMVEPGLATKIRAKSLSSK